MDRNSLKPQSSSVLQNTHTQFCSFGLHRFGQGVFMYTQFLHNPQLASCIQSSFKLQQVLQLIWITKLTYDNAKTIQGPSHTSLIDLLFPPWTSLFYLTPWTARTGGLLQKDFTRHMMKIR